MTADPLEGAHDFFVAAASASAALIGLLFVAISVAPDQIVGPRAQTLHRIRSTMALTGFASTLVLSLIALLPDTHLGWPATVVGAGGMLFVLTSSRDLRTAEHDRSRRRAIVLLAGFLLVNVFLTVSGVRLIVDPADLGPVSDVGIAAIALVALGIDRSWELVGGRTTGVAGRITDRVVGRIPAD